VVEKKTFHLDEEQAAPESLLDETFDMIVFREFEDADKPQAPWGLGRPGAGCPEKPYPN